MMKGRDQRYLLLGLNFEKKTMLTCSFLSGVMGGCVFFADGRIGYFNLCNICLDPSFEGINPFLELS